MSLLLSVGQAWRRCGPHLPSPRVWQQWPGIILGLATGVGGMACLYACLSWGWGWTCSSYSLGPVALSLTVALLLAAGEELLFRGYLWGVLREERGELSAVLWISGVFALVHLLRPGALEFKLAYGVGLFLLSAVLCRMARESGGLGLGIGFHAGIVTVSVLEAPARMPGGWLCGLNGEAAAGLLGWILLTLLWFICRWLARWVAIDGLAGRMPPRQ